MECDAQMKPELSLTARSTWRDPVPEKPVGPGRTFWAAIVAVVAVACLAFLLSSGQFRAPAFFGPYSVSVPLNFRAYDPERWAIMNAEDYEDALKIDPTLPNPTASAMATRPHCPPPIRRYCARKPLSGRPPNPMCSAASPRSTASARIIA